MLSQKNKSMPKILYKDTVLKFKCKEEIWLSREKCACLSTETPVGKVGRMISDKGWQFTHAR